MNQYRIATLVAFLLFCSASFVAADITPAPLPLINGNFADPAVKSPDNWLNGVQAKGWTYDGNNLEGVGVQVETWKDNHPQQFFWNGPDGSISQIIDSAKYKVGHAGDIYTLTATLGGNGKGTLHEITSLLIEGKPAISAPSNLVDPQGPILPVSVTYTAKKSDVGKSIGVRFAWQKPQTDMQAQVDDVSMTVTSKH